MLYLKNLALQKDLRYSAELVRTAISMPDRRKLFLFMEDRSDETPLVEEAGNIHSPSGFSIIDRFLHVSATAHSDETSGDIITSFIMPGSELQATSIVKPTVPGIMPSEKPTPVPVLVDPVDKLNPVIFEGVVNESIPGGISLDYLSYQKHRSNKTMEDEQPVTSTAPLKGHELIDAFLTNEKSRTRPDFPMNEIVSANSQETEEVVPEPPSVTIPEASFSEALAKIYLKQKRYDRALEIIKTLSLKYPEKNSYFADQIRFLEKLIINTK